VVSSSVWAFAAQEHTASMREYIDQRPAAGFREFAGTAAICCRMGIRYKDRQASGQVDVSSPAAKRNPDR
jgi:hypothetical protein